MARLSKILLLSSILQLLLITSSYTQGLLCQEADPFCTGTIYTFPAGTTGTAESGPYYGCLYSQPCPAWYYMRIGNPGSITIYMYSTPLRDIDFICWGPFADAVTPCSGGLTADKMVDCCYCPDPQEWCDIPNGQTGEYYILLITNYSQQACNITFSQTAGTGSTDCTILPPPVSNDSPLCVGDTLHLYADTVINATYAWTGPNGFTSTLQNPSIPNVTLANEGDYSCIIMLYGQNSTPAITTVFINDLPDAALIRVDTTTCPAETVWMLVQLTGEGPFEVLYTDGGNNYIASNLNGPTDTIFVYPSGPAIYTLTDVSDTNCSKILTGLTFEVFNFPVATGLLTGDVTICQGDTAQLVFNLTGNPPWSITYTQNGINPQTVIVASTPFFLYVAPTISTFYQFTQLADLHCTGIPSGDAFITIDQPDGTMIGDATICAGDSAILIFIMSGFPPYTITYTANGSAPQTITADYSPFSIAVYPTITTLYEFTQLTDGFCAGTAAGQALITIHQPSGILSGTDTVCSGDPGQITFNLTGNPPWNITYTENGINPQNMTVYSTPYNLAVSPPVTTLYQIIHLEDSDCEGTATGEALISVNPDPMVYAGADQTIPNGTSTQLPGEVTGGSGNYNYQWEPAGKLVNPAALQPTTINLYETTLFTLTATDNNGGCYGIDDILVTITGGVLGCSPFAAPAIICRGESSQLQAMASGGSGSFTYSWISDPPGFFSDISDPVVIPVLTTNYIVAVDDGYNITNGNTLITVNQLPLPDAGADQVIVYGLATTLDGSATSGSGNYSYHWEPADKLLNPDIPDPVTINLYETTLFTLMVSDLQTGCVCSEADVVEILISGSALSINPTAQPNLICSGDTTQLFALAGGGTGSYTYSWTSDPPGFTSSLPDPIVQPLITTIYSVEVTDGYSLANGSAGVTVNPSPVVNLGPDTTICVYDTITIDAGNPGASYRWSNGSTERTIKAGSTGIGYDIKSFIVTVTSQEGCEDIGQITVFFDFAACNGLNEQIEASSIHIFPNPGNGLFFIESERIEGEFLLYVTDMFGRDIIKNREIFIGRQVKRYACNIGNFPPGIYLVRIINAGNRAISEKYILVR
jgi:hypothetical protein